MSEFCRKTDSRDGLHTWCKGSLKEYHDNWRAKDPEKTSAWDAKRYLACKGNRVRCIKRWGKAHPEKIAQYKTKRRANKASVLCEDVDPFEIFERDKWKCRACNRATPKELRGSGAVNAPVLDHIIPLKLGGPHTRKNLQCLCRSCNSKKSAKYEGQLAFA